MRRLLIGAIFVVAAIYGALVVFAIAVRRAEKDASVG
jgi:hypothetical protein